MTDWTTPPLDEIRGLVAERSRFESWLSTLEARRSATPAHVFDRVWQDYDGRRQRVADTLTGHLGALQAAESGLAGRHDELSRALDERRDALAEVELRALVGEFDEQEGAGRREEVLSSIAELERESGVIGGELAEVRDLTAQVRGPEVAPPRPPEPPPTPPDDGIASPSAPVRPQIGDVDGALYAGDTRAEHHFAPPVPGGTPAVGAPAVGTPAGSMEAQGAGRDSYGTPTFASGQGLAEAAIGVPTVNAQSGDAAFGTAGAAQKTLKCQECGAMNYPTEWYCERCGGELAAL
jgi:hypothetical protein